MRPGCASHDLYRVKALPTPTHEAGYVVGRGSLAQGASRVVSDRGDEFVELDEPAAPHEVRDLRHDHGDDPAMGIVQPARAVAARPAVATRDWPFGVRLGHDGYAETPATAAQDWPAAGHLRRGEVVCRDQFDGLLR